MQFKPYLDSIRRRPERASDRGYYFRFLNNVDIRLIRYTLEDNGFRECGPRNSDWTVMWSVQSMRSQNLQSLTKY